MHFSRTGQGKKLKTKLMQWCQICGIDWDKCDCKTKHILKKGAILKSRKVKVFKARATQDQKEKIDYRQLYETVTI